MSEKEFSVEQSEELIANLKSGKPSEFEQLRSALNLLAHTPEISPISMPPLMPSTVRQPVPVVAIKSSKPRRTIVTSIVLAGLFASGSLAAAAVTGIGPSIFVNAGHSAANFVRNVVGGVGHIVTGNDSNSNLNQASNSANPGDTVASATGSTILPIPTLSPVDGSNENDSEHSSNVLPLISNLIPPLTTPILTNPTTDSNQSENQTPNSTHETQGPTTEESHQSAPRVEKSQSPSEDQNQSESHPVARPTPEASSSAEPTNNPQATPTVEPSILPTAEPSILPTGSSSETESEN